MFFFIEKDIPPLGERYVFCGVTGYFVYDPIPGAKQNTEPKCELDTALRWKDTMKKMRIANTHFA